MVLFFIDPQIPQLRPPEQIWRVHILSKQAISFTQLRSHCIGTLGTWRMQTAVPPIAQRWAHDTGLPYPLQSPLSLGDNGASGTRCHSGFSSDTTRTQTARITTIPTITWAGYATWRQFQLLCARSFWSEEYTGAPLFWLRCTAVWLYNLQCTVRRAQNCIAT